MISDDKYLAHLSVRVLIWHKNYLEQILHYQEKTQKQHDQSF